MNRRRWIILTIAIVVIAGSVALIWGLSGDPRLVGGPRREWAAGAITRIERLLENRQAVEADVRHIQSATSTTRPRWDAWVGEDLLLMKNGEWIVCQSICSKQDQRIHDLFIGRGSDGNWYYSTFHFCIGKVVLREQRQPQTLAEFVDAYWLVRFDGRPEECLTETWRFSDPWGDEKVQITTATTRP